MWTHISGDLMPTYIQVPSILGKSRSQCTGAMQFLQLLDRPWWFMILELALLSANSIQDCRTTKIVQTPLSGFGLYWWALKFAEMENSGFFYICSTHWCCWIVFRVASANWLLAIYWRLNLNRLNSDSTCEMWWNTLCMPSTNQWLLDWELYLSCELLHVWGMVSDGRDFRA